MYVLKITDTSEFDFKVTAWWSDTPPFLHLFNNSVEQHAIPSQHQLYI